MKKMICKFMLLFSFLFFSCSSEPIGSTIYDTDIHIWLRDDNFNNLLNPENPNSFKKDDISVFALEMDGSKTEIYNPSFDAPRGFIIFEVETKSDKENICRLFPYIGKSKNTEVTTTLIQWRTGIVDTVKCEIFKKGKLTYTDKVWYNKVLKYDNNNKSLNNNSLENVTRLIEVRK